MTPKTLRKERREKLNALLIEERIFRDNSVMRGELVEKIINAVESRTEVRGIEAAMFGNRTVTESDLPIGDEALKAFERDMQCPGSWSWYPAKSSDEPAWKSLREFVVTLYQQDKKAFEKYHTWAGQPYSRGAKSVGQIRLDPACFEFAWADYRLANPAVENTPPDLPTYKLADDSQFVPAPEKK